MESDLADIELAANYCFDVLLETVLKQEAEALPSFPEQKCGVYVQWRKYQGTKRSATASEKPKPVGANLVQMKAVSLHDELGTIVRKSAKGSKAKAITVDDVPYLECTLTTVTPGSLAKTSVNDSDWVQGRDGLVVSFEAPDDSGKVQKLKSVFFPDYLQYYQWTMQEAMVKGISRKYAGRPTKEILESVRVQKFSTESVSVFFEDYMKYREDSELVEELKRQWKAGRKKSAKVSKKDGEKSFFWTFAGAICLIGLLLVYLRYSQLTYSVDYDEYLANYEILGIDQEATAKEVKTAFRKLSKQWHPDKNPGCKECPETFRKIVEAHKQINDYEKGILTFNNHVPLNSRYRP